MNEKRRNAIYNGTATNQNVDHSLLRAIMTYVTYSNVKVMTNVWRGTGMSLKLGILTRLTIKKARPVKTSGTIKSFIRPLNNVTTAKIPPAAVIGTPEK